MSHKMVTAKICWVPSVIFHLLMAYSNAQMSPTNWDRGRFPSGDDAFNKNSNSNDNFFRNGFQPGQGFPNQSPQSGNDGADQISPPPQAEQRPSGGFGFRQGENTPPTPSFNSMGQGSVQTNQGRPELSAPAGMGGLGGQDQFFKAPTPVTTSRTPFKEPEPGTVGVIRPLEQASTRSGRDSERGGLEPLGKGRGQGAGQDSFKIQGRGAGQDSFRNQGQRVSQDSFKNQGRGAGQDSFRNQGQGVDQDAFRNQGQGVDQDSFKNQGQGAGQDSFKNQGQGVGQDAFRNQGQGVGQDSFRNKGQGVGQNAFRNQGQDSFRNNDPETSQDKRRPRQQPQVPERLFTSQDKLRGIRRSTGENRRLKN